MRRRRWLHLVVVLMVVAVSLHLFVGREEPAPFALDPTQPFRLEIGRGSGRKGLDTVKIDQTGLSTLHRRKSEQNEAGTVSSWVRATLLLSPEALAEVRQAIETNDLLRLRNAYHDDSVEDGLQWVLWLTNGEHEKAVYCNNRFPQSIKAFAVELDAILTKSGIDRVVWQAVPEREARHHEGELWNSIKR